MQPDGIGQLYDFLYSTFPKFGMSYHIVYLEFDFAVFGAFVGLFTAVGVPDGNCLVVNRVFQSFVIIVLQKAFSNSVIRRRCGAHKRAAVFPGAPVLPGLPVVLRRYFHIVLHIMGVFVLIKIQAILFGKRLLYGITNKQKGKIEAFFFVGRSQGIRAKYSFIVTKADRYRSPPKTKFAVKSLEQSVKCLYISMLRSLGVQIVMDDR